ncbi:MAG: DNA topoisomerase IV subunit A [Lentisphaerae bacterium]|nr:DNA topoisomerase IV subunit A [Lentisphaerota bacterium]
MAEDDQFDLDMNAAADSNEPVTKSVDVLADEHGPLRIMVDSNFMQYASYVICERAIPHLDDGFKPVQRRIMHSLYEKDDGRFTKVANIVGHTMQYHPHGDAAISDALVNLVNKNYLIEGQGNFGNIHTGDAAAAPRYIECRLTDLAREQLFNPKLTQYLPSYDGRNREPATLPAKLPLLLMLGAEGIAVGLSTRILSHNFIELLEAEIAVLMKQPFALFPDFLQGGLMDVSEYDDGRGSVKVRASIKHGRPGTLIIHDLPFGVTTESLIKSIEEAARRKKVPVETINDFTSETVEIELCLAPGSDPTHATDALYAFTNCQTILSSHIVVIHNRRPVSMTISEVIQANAARLTTLLKRELALAKKELLEEIHVRTLTRIFIEERIYKKIEECKTQDAVMKAVSQGLNPFRNELQKDITRNDIDMLLALRIRRISLFDINKNRSEIEDLRKKLENTEKNLKDITTYAVKTLKGFITKYRESYPRRTQRAVFDHVEAAKLTANELEINFDKTTGYLGYKVAGETMLQCSSLDKLVLVWKNGKYRCVMPPDKMFADKNLISCAVMDRDRVMTVVYETGGLTYLKRFVIGGVILNKDYFCTLENAKILYLQEGTPDEIYVKYKLSKGQRIHQQIFKPGDTPVKSAKARGNQMTSKSIAKIATKKPRWWQENANSPRGVFM